MASRRRHTTWRSCLIGLLHLTTWVASYSSTGCPKSCSLHGTCNEEIGRCDCPRHYSGPTCEKRLSTKALLDQCHHLGFASLKLCDSPDNWCINGCNGRGKCVAGFCHCEQGFFGADCALSMGPNGKPVLLAGRGYQPRARGPRVYVYELPPNLTSWRNVLGLDRPFSRNFLERLTATGARVADGDTADWYYIPITLRALAHSHLVAEAVEYIRTAHPWFNRTQGYRHFVIMAGDKGRSELLLYDKPLTANLTFVTHWGLYADRPEVRWRASHRNNTDIVLPAFLYTGHMQRMGTLTSRNHPKFMEKARPEVRERDGPLFFFAGSICGDHSPPRKDGKWLHCASKANSGYSAGTRQKVHYYHWNRTGFVVELHDKEYAKHLLTSKFCFGPTGGGYGLRQFQVTLAGCVPVVIADKVLLAFEPYLDWGSFGVRVAEEDIPQLHTIVNGISEKDYARKVSRLRCAAQHMAMSSVTGGILGEDGRFDAFETLLEILRAKAAHPDAPPEKLRSLDPDFDAFMDCREPAATLSRKGMRDGEKTSPKGYDDATGLCSISDFDKGDPDVVMCRDVSRKGPEPVYGGMMCAGTPDDPAACVRPWP